MHLNEKNWKKAGNMTIYGYENGRRGKKAIEKYLISSRIR